MDSIKIAKFSLSRLMEINLTRLSPVNIPQTLPKDIRHKRMTNDKDTPNQAE